MFVSTSINLTSHVQARANSIRLMHQCINSVIKLLAINFNFTLRICNIEVMDFVHPKQAPGAAMKRRCNKKEGYVTDMSQTTQATGPVAATQNKSYR
jgi:hypothetical protein